LPSLGNVIGSSRQLSEQRFDRRRTVDRVVLKCAQRKEKGTAVRRGGRGTGACSNVSLTVLVYLAIFSLFPRITCRHDSALNGRLDVEVRES